MRTLAIGDIHGCFTALLAVADAAEITTDDRLVTLGDYIDRGPEVPQVLGWLRDRYRTGNLVPLLGNHELMLQAGRENTHAYECWLANGGRDTLLAYTPPGMEPSLEHFPQEDWEFIEKALSIRSYSFCLETHFRSSSTFTGSAVSSTANIEPSFE